jgi:hypothetical protein
MRNGMSLSLRSNLLLERHYARSPPISIEDIGSVHFRLPRSGDNRAYDLVRADVRIEGSTIFIFLNLATGDWPFVVENESDYSLEFFQQVCILVLPIASSTQR